MEPAWQQQQQRGGRGRGRGRGRGAGNEPRGRGRGQGPAGPAWGASGEFCSAACPGRSRLTTGSRGRSGPGRGPPLPRCSQRATTARSGTGRAPLTTGLETGAGEASHSRGTAALSSGRSHTHTHVCISLFLSMWVCLYLSLCQMDLAFQKGEVAMVCQVCAMKITGPLL